MDQAVNENFVGPRPLARDQPIDAGPWTALPNEAPLDMPEQDFAARIERKGEPRRRSFWVPRAAIFVGAAVLTAAFAREMFGILAFGVMTPLQFLFLVLSTISFCWIAIGSLSAAMGFLPLFVGERPDEIAAQPLDTPMRTRTALLFPVYHEDPARIAGGIEAMANELQAVSRNGNFDIFVLSDTRGDADGAVEAAAYKALAERLQPVIAVYYRRRVKNHAKKAGNIADWITRFGAAYEQFVILDADSVMSGETLVTLALAIERDPKAGLIQTVPRLVGGETLLQKLQAFASNTYGPAVAAGIAFWHRDQGNYWGHNAIIRTRAFASAAGLPDLTGRKPFGGHILSHDFVEAVLLQRAGWGVHMMPTLAGSYEGMPPNIIDVVTRDRRWAQGNLQHLAIVGQAGVTPMGRVHLGMGAASYLISAVWAMSLMVGVILALQSQQLIPSYFQDEKTLFPIWPVIDPGAALRLFLATLVVVLLPKGLGLILEWRRAKSIGGALRSTFGVGIETIYSMLIAPILMITQTVGAIQILLGFDSGWSAQKRDDGRLPLGVSLWFARWHTAVGFVVAVIAWNVSPGLLAWMAPVVLGLLLAGPVTWYTSLRASRLASWAMATSEDKAPPAVLVSANSAANEWRERIASAMLPDRVAA